MEIVCQICQRLFTTDRPIKRVNGARDQVYYYCSKHCAQTGTFYGQGYKPRGTKYRQDAFQKLPNICARCAYSRDFRMIDVHHRDGNHNNNELANLEILCVWCHRLETSNVPVHNWDGLLTTNDLDLDTQHLASLAAGLPLELDVTRLKICTDRQIHEIELRIMLLTLPSQTVDNTTTIAQDHKIDLI